MTRSIEDAIFELLSDRPPGASIAPEQAARAADPDLWRQRLAQVRSTAIGLARQGRLEITRKGRLADPETLKGVYRLRLPVAAGEAVGVQEDGAPLHAVIPGQSEA